MREGRAMRAIETITRETGYPPTPDELAAGLGCSVRSVHSALMGAKRRGLVGYDEDGRLVLAASVPSGPAAGPTTSKETR